MSDEDFRAQLREVLLLIWSVAVEATGEKVAAIRADAQAHPERYRN